MSGGVDSSVSAWLLQQQGYQVEGLFMKNWEEDDGEEYCTAAADLADARLSATSSALNCTPLTLLPSTGTTSSNCSLPNIKPGRTPNPDILCNKEIKFKAFLEFAAEDLGADYIATVITYVGQMSMARAACCVAWTAIKTRATSFIRSAMSKLRKACSRSANWKNRRCVRLLKISVWSPRRKKTLRYLLYRRA